MHERGGFSVKRCPNCDHLLSEWEGGEGLYWCLQGCGEYFARNVDDSVGVLVTDSSSRVARAPEVANVA
jgi:hypothetical protein